MSLSFPLTSTSWTLHQQKLETVRKRKQWQGKWKHTLPPLFYIPNTLWIVMLLADCMNWSNWGKGNSLQHLRFDLNKSLLPHFHCLHWRKLQVPICIKSIQMWLSATGWCLTVHLLVNPFLYFCLHPNLFPFCLYISVKYTKQYCQFPSSTLLSFSHSVGNLHLCTITLNHSKK